MKRLYFTTTELVLWGMSVLGVVLSFLIFDRAAVLTLSASLIGVTSLIFNAKGNPIGQVLMLIFSVLYGVISWRCAYYGEMITYLGMTAPMAAVALYSWLRHPYRGNRSQVTVGSLSVKDGVGMAMATVFVTVCFYFILRFFGTARLLISTISVSTSFVAAYLTFRRSPWFAVAYAANDLVLIVLWSLVAMVDRAYFSVVVCFAAFLVNDLYGFINWQHMKQQQSGGID